MTPDIDITSDSDTNFLPISFCPPPLYPFIYLFLDEYESNKRIFL